MQEKIRKTRFSIPLLKLIHVFVHPTSPAPSARVSPTKQVSHCVYMCDADTDVTQITQEVWPSACGDTRPPSLIGAAVGKHAGRIMTMRGLAHPKPSVAEWLLVVGNTSKKKTKELVSTVPTCCCLTESLHSNWNLALIPHVNWEHSMLSWHGNIRFHASMSTTQK